MEGKSKVEKKQVQDSGKIKSRMGPKPPQESRKSPQLPRIHQLHQKMSQLRQPNPETEAKSDQQEEVEVEGQKMWTLPLQV